MAKHSHIPDRIISILVENPATTRTEISKTLGVTYQSVQKHLLLLKDQGVILPSFLVAEKKIRKKHTFWIFILTQNPNRGEVLETDYQRELCKEIAHSFHDPKLSPIVDPGMIFGGVDIVIGGQYDIILRIHSDNPDSVGRYVTQILRGRREIASTSTAWSLNENSSSPSEVGAAREDSKNSN